MYLAIFEFLGTSELLIILVIALVLFGPRKLPQLSRQLGKSLGEFKRASEDFKRTWEKEVELEKFEEEGRMARAMLQDDSTVGDASERRSALDAATTENDWGAQTIQPTVARSASNSSTDANDSTGSSTDEPIQAVAAESSAGDAPAKRDWL
jgi:sec-independent protein translocase protein TatB